MGEIVTRKGSGGFTLVEMLTVVVIIIILAGLVISTAGFIQKKAARERAKAEIAAMEAALESYRADNGIYPDNTDVAKGAKVLYQALTGDGDDALVASGGVASAGMSKWGDKGKTYFEFDLKKQVNTNNWTVIDPWGAPYFYATGTNRFNPATFDLFSTGGKGIITDTNSTNVVHWIKNW